MRRKRVVRQAVQQVRRQRYRCVHDQQHQSGTSGREERAEPVRTERSHCVETDDRKGVEQSHVEQRHHARDGEQTEPRRREAPTHHRHRVERVVDLGIGVQRDEQHIRPPPEDALRAVAVMDVDVEDRDDPPFETDGAKAPAKKKAAAPKAEKAAAPKKTAAKPAAKKKGK